MNKKPQTSSSPEEKAPAAGKPEADQAGPSLNPRQQAIRYKAFRHTFSQRDLKDLSDKKILKKLRKSKGLEEDYRKYLEKIKDNPRKTRVFPWENPFHRTLFLCHYWGLRITAWFSLALLVLLIINFIPGPTQHVVELLLARSIYDTAPIKRLPEGLESYAHSAKIVDTQGAIIKSYGKRRVTQQIPEQVKKALLACEDHYFLPHPHNPWYVNAFFIHAGVSWPNLFGAVKDTLLGRSRGGSTIVMQNAKKILGNTERTIGSKVEEIILSYLMVSTFGKEPNLDFYINTVPVGANIYGFPAAATNYFKKNLSELNPQQLVAIGSFIPNHHRQLAFYEIVRGKSFLELSDTMRAHAREGMDKINSSLAYLRDRREITEEAYRNWLLADEESIRRIGFREYGSPLYGKEEWTSWNVIRELCARDFQVDGRTISGSQLILDEPGDVVIETRVDLALVDRIKEIIGTFLASSSYQRLLRERNRDSWQQDLALYQKGGQDPPYRDYESFLQYLNRHLNVGVIIIDQQGQVIAYVGGKEFRQDNGEGESAEQGVVIDLMNRDATIPVSSTIKPIIAYYAMVANNADLATSFLDKPMEYKYVESAGREMWLPRNWYDYDEPGRGANRYLGRKYSLLEAQVLSVNTIFARLYTNRALRNAMLIGFDEIGLAYDQEDAKYWPFGIGASSVPVQQWLGVYNAFLDGYYREPSFVSRIFINGRVIYDRLADQEHQPVMLFDARQERETEMQALYEVCNRGTAANLRSEFKHAKNLISGKTGTAPEGRSALFVSHFNPYRDRNGHADRNLTMLVMVTTNTGGHKDVGTSSQGPTLIAGRIYNHLFQEELRRMMDRNLEQTKKENAHFRNNHLYWANVNRYMEHLLSRKCGRRFIHENIIGIDGYEEAMQQLLNSSNQIYTGRDDLFGQLVDYYCDEEKIVKIEQ